MNIDSLYPSKYLKSEDLKGRRVQCVIDSVEVEEMSDGVQKPCLTFKGREKSMVLNKTNADVLKAAFGPETNDWQGQKGELFTQQVAFKGQMTSGLRLSPILDREPGADDEPDF